MLSADKALAPGEVGRVIALCAEPVAANREGRIERKSGLGGGLRLKRGLRFVPDTPLSVICRAVEGTNSGWARYLAALHKAGLPE